jgi:acetyl-CoA carboxylase biotin carboxyl carrier protein
MELERIESLLKLMQEYGVAELGIEEENTAVHLRLMGEGAAAPAAVVAAPAALATPAAAPAPSANLTEVKSPMVGTFYRAPKPESPAFVKVGDQVSIGQTLCIVEAMKLMNEIEAEVSGTVREVLSENGQPVQFGQVLFHIEAD